MTPFKIGYFADGPWSHGSLDLITSDPSLAVEFICARYDAPDPVLREKANFLNIPFLTHENVNSPAFTSLLSDINCDIFVSMSFNQILRPKTYSLPRFGTINCHAGMLPYYRGRNILNWALINDEKSFGITVHYVDSGVDTGDIISQKSFPICDNDDYSSLLKVAYKECPPLLYGAILDICNCRADRIPQKTIHPHGSYFSQRVVGDEIIDWNQPSRSIFNFVRALSTPGPNAQTFVGSNCIKIAKVELIDTAPIYKCIPGAILAKDDNTFIVKTSDSYLRLLQWQCDFKLAAGMRFS
ncbi:methionyl-tRNA formyltransferase [Synechococcus sp. RS9916]|uniref:methionyl-tRNA formyltransferase n=1 Tax=Synechococcus sp. RS9916 TaxID=221359 RepID=UPI0009040CEB|nr:methionyl-tRNA formyltransferase [Synechococcus sp. RS9916]